MIQVKAECLKCNSIDSDVPFEKWTTHVKEVHTKEEANKIFTDNLIHNKNSMGDCEHCGQPLTVKCN